MAKSLSFTPASSLLLTLPAILGLVMLPSCMANNILGSPGTLYAGSCLALGCYTFCMQDDCNLVLYDNGDPKWASGTSGKAYNCYLTMQNDGNLVIYGTDGRAVWASNTARANGNYILVLQSDRNVLVYGPAIWATGSNAVNIGGVNNSSTAGFASVNATGEDGKNIAMVVAN